MGTPESNLVTGAFSYTGKYITQRFLSIRETVKTLTGRSHIESPFGSQVTTSPFSFDNLSLLTESLRGITTLYDTYWVRYCYGRLKTLASTEFYTSALPIPLKNRHFPTSGAKHW